ncbi:MAG: hypothetical protein WCQ91_06160, partial [Planctomycetota bacterium]
AIPCVRRPQRGAGDAAGRARVTANLSKGRWASYTPMPKCPMIGLRVPHPSLDSRPIAMTP